MASSAPRYLVTGGAGFIGSNIISALTKAGERVRAIDNLATGRWGLVDRLAKVDLVEKITGDIRDPETVAAAMRGVEVVFHEAALGSVPRSIETPVETDRVNVGGTVVVLDEARRAGVKRVIFAASSSAYGDAPTLPKREDMPALPLSPYAVTKVACEGYMNVFYQRYGLETLCLRYFNVFGPNQLPDGPYAAAIPRFLRAAIAGEPIVIYGDGSQTRDFCFIDNTVSANLLAAASPHTLSGQIVNVAGGRRISLTDLVDAIGVLVGGKVEVRHVEARAGDVKHSLADISRAREMLGYEPKVTWEQGLPQTLAFLREIHEKGTPVLAARPSRSRRRALFRRELARGLDELAHDLFERPREPLIADPAVGRKDLSRPPDPELRGDDHRAEGGEHLAQLGKHARGGERPGGGAEERDHLPPPRLGRGARAPVDDVLQRARDRAVVLGGRDQDRARRGHACAKGGDLRRHPRALDVAVVGRHRQLAEVERVDLGAEGLRVLGTEQDQLAVERAEAKRAGEREELDRHRGDSRTPRATARGRSPVRCASAGALAGTPRELSRA